MRVLFLPLAAAGLLMAGPLAMPVSAASPKAKAVSHQGHYECPKCHQHSAKAGKFPKCKVAFVSEGRAHAAHTGYECKMCKVKSAKAGKCPKCKMMMTKIVAHSHQGHDSHKGHSH